MFQIRVGADGKLLLHAVRAAGFVLLVAMLAGALIALIPAPALAQDYQDMQDMRERAEELLGRELTPEEMLRLLQQSGMTPEEVRERLAEQGFPSDAADAYLNVLEGRASQVPPGTNPLPLVQALTGVELRGMGEAPDTARYGLIDPSDSVALADTAMLELPPGPPIFGMELFRRATSQFVALTMGPVPPDYRVGPGDQLILVVTGDVEAAYDLTVSREGWIVIPDLGRVFVAGETISSLERTLTNRLSGVYSGLTGGPEATTFLTLSLGELRTSQIYVVGEVQRPGAYELSSLSTALTALYWAGGPTRAGSFREILVNRGGETVARVDLYDYLLRGMMERDIRLESGDVVFVPLAKRRVQIDGAVMRPAIYELEEGEGLDDALRYAGGVEPNALVERVQIERILPPEERQPGWHRVLLDVPLTSLMPEGAGDADADAGGADAGAGAAGAGAADAGAGAADAYGAELAGGNRAAPELAGGPAEPGVQLLDGDRVIVFALLDEPRNTVRVSGAVWRPGVYGVEPGLRLWDLIEVAGGLLPDVYRARAQIQRLEQDYTRSMIQVSLRRDGSGAPAENPLIEPLDQVLVFAARDLRDAQVVSVGGWVREPGLYPYSEGMTVRDLILRAGGLRNGAYLERADVSRLIISQGRADTITRRFRVPLDSGLVRDGAGADGAEGGSGHGSADGSAPEERLTGANFVLSNLDAVYVRRAPGFEPQRGVTVTGEVVLPGPYSLRTRQAHLADLIRMAGGLTDEAYVGGVELWRADSQARADSIAVRLYGPGILEDSIAAATPLGIAPGGDAAVDSAYLAYLASRGVPVGRFATRDTAPAVTPGYGVYAAGAYPPPPYMPGAYPPYAPGALPPAGYAPQEAGAAGDRLDLPDGAFPPDGAGTTPRTAPVGARVDSTTVRTRIGVDLAEALEDAESAENILLQPGDSIHIPSYIPTVRVQGEVGRPTRVVYKQGEGLDYYIDRAGGYAQDADAGRTWVRYGNGQIQTAGGGFLFFGGGVDAPDPGSVITVPREQRREGGISFAQMATILGSLATAAATIIIATRR